MTLKEAQDLSDKVDRIIGRFMYYFLKFFAFPAIVIMWLIVLYKYLNQ